jgi:uracil-DNA glycosylase
VANPYWGAAGEARVHNLRTYLAHLAQVRPSLVLIGEAPGYRGCAITGVPFTSRALLACDLGRWGLFAGRGFAHDRAMGAAENEITATVVWRTVVACLPDPPLTWNAFPFHPHPPVDTRANRPLAAADFAAGADYLQQFLSLFPDVPAAAMGRQAERALVTVGVTPLAALRHPAHGGATAFAAGLRAVARRLPAAGV